MIIKIDSFKTDIDTIALGMVIIDNGKIIYSTLDVEEALSLSKEMNIEKGGTIVLEQFIIDNENRLILYHHFDDGKLIFFIYDSKLPFGEARRDFNLQLALLK